MAVETVRAFLDALEASNLLETEQLAEAKDIAGRTEEVRVLAQTLVRRERLSRWQAEQLLAGRTKCFVGKYKLISLIGRGGMSSVYLARHMMMNRPVALKLISRRLDNDPPALERFLGEVRAIASMDHPNIVHAYNVDCDDGRYFLVMEYIEGQDLKRMVDTHGPLAFDKAADYVQQAAEGLAHAHAKGIVHRDIKPANLLVNPQGVVKILDLGIAEFVDPRAERDSADDDKDGALVGTVDYMAPEQAMGDPHADHRVDLYSLGCTLHFLLTGHAPFAEGTLHERIVKHQSVDPPDLSTLRADTPRELGDLCRRLMSKQAADRPQSAQEVVAYLSHLRPRLHRMPKATPLTDAEMEELMAQESPSTTASEQATQTPDGLWQRLSPARQRTILISGAAGCLLVVCVTVASVFYFHGGPRQAKSTAAKTQQPISAVPPPNGDAEPDDIWGLMTEPNGPGKTDPGKTVPAKAAPAKTDPAKTTPGKTDPGKAAPAKAEFAKAVPAKTEPAKTDPGKTDPGKTAPAKTEPAKAVPAKTDPGKTVPAKTEPGKPPVDVWKDFPKAVELPPLDLPEAGAAAPPPVLLRVPASPETPWTLLLLGGKEALRGGRRIVMAEQEGGGGVVRYTVRVENATADAEPAEIGVFSREQDALKFHWSATADSAANALRNCLLSVTAAGQTRAVALRKPVSADPLVFDLSRPISVQSTSVEWLPDPTQLRLEVLKFEVLKFEGLADLTVVPPDPLSTKGHAAIVVARKDSAGRPAPAVEFRLSFTLKRPKVQVDAKLMTPTAQQFRPFEMPAIRIEADERIKTINRDLPAAKPDVKRMLEQEFEVRRRQIWYDEFYKAVHRKGKMHFRIYLPVGEQQVEILRTAGP